MAETTPSQRQESAAVYWRRRVAVLVVSMSVLAGITWSAAVVLSGAAHSVAAAAGRTGQPARSVPQASNAGAAAGVQNGVAADKLAVPAHVAGRSCPAGEVVITLSATQPSYAAWQQPRFVVDVVSWASDPCSFDVGAGHVVLAISAGPAQIWTSADCAEGLASQPVTLHRSVPAVVAMTWDEQHSSAGCPVPGQVAPAGSYTARATDGSADSNDVTFSIS